jgi:hypothetical protein
MWWEIFFLHSESRPKIWKLNETIVLYSLDRVAVDQWGEPLHFGSKQVLLQDLLEIWEVEREEWGACADRPKDEWWRWSWSWCQPSRSLVMLCSLAATVGGGERDAVKYEGAVESETEWRHGRWRFLSLAAPLSWSEIRVVGGESGCGEPRTSSRQHPTLYIAQCDKGPLTIKGWAPSIRARDQSPASHWARWGRDQPNILPLDLTHTLTFNLWLQYFSLYSFHHK